MKKPVILIMVALMLTARLTAMAALVPQPTVEPGKGTHSGGIKDENTGIDVNLQSSDGTDTIHKANSLAVQFYATTSFTSITKSLYTSSGTLTITIYKWLGSYEATIGSGKQIAAQQKFDDISANGKRIVMTFDPLPDGEYVIYVSDPVEGGVVGGTAKTDATSFSTHSYKDDVYWENAAISFLVHYTNTPNTLLGPVQDPYGIEAPTTEEEEQNPQTGNFNFMPMIMVLFLGLGLVLLKSNMVIVKHK